ncbi:hypothetical protein AtEden1_Chr1g0060891 [Arabidopsis thaliana]
MVTYFWNIIIPSIIPNQKHIAYLHPVKQSAMTIFFNLFFYAQVHENLKIELGIFSRSILPPSSSSLQEVLRIIQYSLCFGATIKNSILMVDAVYAVTQILALTIIFVTFARKSITKNASSLRLKSNTLITLSIRSNFTFTSFFTVLIVYAVEEECNFVFHSDCMYSPRVIKISRHHHRISNTLSLRLGEWSCGVCHQIIDGDYGAYTCDKCDHYVVHSRCALEKNVWDGEDLEGLPDEDDITQDIGSFNIISKEVILHFLHDHHLLLEVSILYNEKKTLSSVLFTYFRSSCNRGCRGFVYECRDGKLIWRVCKTERHNQLNCIKCDFIVCMKCATLPYRARYEHDKHFLTAIWEEEVREKDWCEVCERNLRDTNTKVFYWCVECCTIFHIECVLGKNSNLSLSQTLKFWVQRAQILLENLNL